MRQTETTVLAHLFQTSCTTIVTGSVGDAGQLREVARLVDQLRISESVSSWCGRVDVSSSIDEGGLPSVAATG